MPTFLAHLEDVHFETIQPFQYWFKQALIYLASPAPLKGIPDAILSVIPLIY